MAETLKQTENVQMALVPLEAIVIGKRYREDLGDLVELEHSIRANGVISPIALSLNTTSGEMTLIAGGRRLEACKQIGLLTIPARIYPDPSSLHLRVLELAENLQRKDMTWKEQTSLQREIHLLQQEQFGTPAAGPTAAGTDPGWRVADTANMLGMSEATVSNSLAIQNTMAKHPQFDWDGCATLKDAKKLASTINEAVIRSEMAKRAEAKKGGSIATLKSKLMDAYCIGDAIEGLRMQPAEMFDLAEIDPPYGIDLPDMKADNDCLNYEEVEGKQYLIFMRQILVEAYRVLKPDSFCILWFGLDPWLESLYKLAMEVGFTGVRTPGIWVKPNGQSMNPNASLAQAYETFFVLRKGKPVLAAPGRHNVFTYAPVPPQQKVHPTERPTELIAEILKTFSFENAKIISPFLGSGKTILAATMTRRTAMGFDLSDSFKGGFIKLLDTHLVED